MGDAHQPADLKPHLAMWGLVLIWAANFSVVKAVLDVFDPLAFNAFRYVLASALMIVLVRRRGGLPDFSRRQWLALIGIGLLGNTLYQVLFILGIDATLAGNSSLILGTVPAYVAILSVWWGVERTGGRTWLGVALSLLGIALVVWGGAQRVGFGGATVRGDVLTVFAAIAWSAYTVLAAPLVRRHGTLFVTAVAMWVGTLGLLAIGAPSLARQDWSAIGPAAWAGTIYSGALSIGVAYLLWYYSVRRMGTTRTALYSNTIPIVALAIAWITLDEVPGPLQIAGAAAIVGGVTLSGVRRKARRPGPAR